MKMNEIQDMTPIELLMKENELRQELFNLRMKSRVGQVEKPSQMRTIRRDIARVLTVLTRKDPEARRRGLAKAAKPEAAVSPKEKQGQTGKAEK